MDLPESVDNLEKLRQALDIEIHPISAATGQGIEELIEKTWRLLAEIPREEFIAGEEAVMHRFEDEQPFTVEIVDGVYEVSGKRIEKLVAMTKFDLEEGLQRFQRTIEMMGLEDELKRLGIKEGDTVRIKDLEFDYSE